MNDDYYQYMIEHSQVEDGLHQANIEALISLKAKAFLEIKERIENGSKEDAKQLRKHKADVFRLSVMLTPESIFELPETIQVWQNRKRFGVLKPPLCFWKIKLEKILS